jgi:hypothetical protein
MSQICPRRSCVHCQHGSQLLRSHLLVKRRSWLDQRGWSPKPWQGFLILLIIIRYDERFQRGRRTKPRLAAHEQP